MDKWVRGMGQWGQPRVLASKPGNWTHGWRERRLQLSSDLHIHEAAWVYPTHEKQINK